MENAISKSEKLDIFLALATFYGLDSDDSNKSESDRDTILRAIEPLSAIGKNDLKKLKRKVKRFENLSSERRQVWQTFWLEKLRNRGQTKRLDENIHPEHIAEILKKEPQTVCEMILTHLPHELSKELIKIAPSIKLPKHNSLVGGLPTEETAAVVRKHFLSNFVALEDIYKPNALDKLSPDQMMKFVWFLGVRETAILCRGISTKENLAVFLKPFNEEVTKEIALNIKELEDIAPERVAVSENIFGDEFSGKSDYVKILKHIGLKLLIVTLIKREKNVRRYCLQKFRKEIAVYFKKFLMDMDAAYETLDTNERNRLDEIGNEIVELSNRYAEEI